VVFCLIFWWLNLRCAPDRFGRPPTQWLLRWSRSSVGWRSLRVGGATGDRNRQLAAWAAAADGIRRERARGAWAALVGHAREQVVMGTSGRWSARRGRRYDVMPPGSSADANLRGSAARAQSGRALCRHCDGQPCAAEDTDAIVRRTRWAPRPGRSRAASPLTRGACNSASAWILQPAAGELSQAVEGSSSRALGPLNAGEGCLPRG
jgi:hypothetical protein